MERNKRMLTLKDIAAHCGVSYSTVSRAFNKDSRISESTRQKILDYANEVHYIPNAAAISLKKNETKTVGIIIPKLSNPFYIDLLEFLDRILKKFGYRLLVSFISNGISSEANCLESMATARVDALIIMGCDADNQNYIHRLSNQITILQLLSNSLPELDSVCVDDFKATIMGTQYLINRGHERILFISDSSRSESYFTAMKRNNIHKENLLSVVEKNDCDEILHQINTLHPTAVMASSVYKENAYRAIKTAGLQIPDDISFFAFGDVQWVQLLEITAMAHNLEEISTAIVDQLVYRLKNPYNAQCPAQHLLFDTFIRERKSVKYLCQ